MLVHPHAVAMIGSKHHNRIVEQSLFFQLADDTADLFVDTCHTGIIIQHTLAVEVSHFCPFGGDDGGVAYCFDIYVAVDLFVFVGNQLISGMRRVHGYDQGKRFACVA